MVGRRFRLLGTLLLGVALLRPAAPVAAAPAATAAPTTADHWHAAYGIYACDHYLPAFNGTEDPDKLGIHTHHDGLIHIHPFTKDAEGAKAVLGLFLETTGITLTTNRLVVPVAKGGLSVKTGDACKTSKGRVRVLSWKNGKDTSPTELTGNPARIALYQGQILGFVFAPDGVTIPVPPSVEELENPCDQQLSAADLAALANPGVKPRPVFPTAAAPTTITVTDLRAGLFGPTSKGKRAFIEYVLYGYNSHKVLGASAWKQGEPPVGVGCIGRGTLPTFLELGLRGMKVGGRRSVIVPPSPDITDTEPTIFLFDLVRLA